MVKLDSGSFTLECSHNIGLHTHAGGDDVQRLHRYRSRNWREFRILDIRHDTDTVKSRAI